MLAAPPDATDRPQRDGAPRHAHALPGGRGQGVPLDGLPPRLRHHRAAAQPVERASLDHVLPEDAVRPAGGVRSRAADEARDHGRVLHGGVQRHHAVAIAVGRGHRRVSRVAQVLAGRSAVRAAHGRRRAAHVAGRVPEGRAIVRCHQRRLGRLKSTGDII